MDNIITFVVGAALGGALAVIIKNKYLGNETEHKLEDRQRELDELHRENEKFHKRNKEINRQIEDLLEENQKLRKQLKVKDEDNDNQEDELLKSKDEVKKLRLQNDDLCLKIQEYKAACEAQEVEITTLKEKLK